MGSHSKSRLHKIFEVVVNHKKISSSPFIFWRCFYETSSVPLNRQGMFFRTENEFSHGVLENLPKYKNTCASLYLLKKCDEPSICKNYIDWEKLSLNDLSLTFKEISIEAKLSSVPLSNVKYSTMCRVIANRCLETTDDHLFTFLRYLSVWPYENSPKEQNFNVLWKALDYACLSRWKVWNIEEILLVNDFWYCLSLMRQSNFVYKSLTKTAMHPNRLLPHHLVQLLFYLNILRTISKGISMYNLEYCLQNSVNQLSTVEIGVALMGFFKTQNVLHSEELVIHIIDRIIKDVTVIPEITLTCLFKVLRGSLTIPLWNRIPELMDALESQFDRLSLKSTVHIALLLSKSLTLHKGTLTKLTQKLTSNIKESRLKDMEKVMYLLTLLNFNPHSIPCIYASVVKEISDGNRTNEFNQYPKSLVALIYYLCLKNYFVEGAVAKVLNMDFVRKTYGKTNFMIGREILAIDTYVELIHPSYSGPRIPEDIRNYLSRRYSTFLPDAKRKLSKHDQFSLQVFNITQKLLGENCVIQKYILPHSSRADIVYHFNSEGQQVPLPDDYRNIKDFTGPVKAPKEGIWFAIIIASRNMYLYNTLDVTGETSSKIEMIRSLGYKPVVVSHWKWPNNEEEQVSYLRELFYS